MRQQLVPPKPKELDMTRVTGPSTRSVRIFMPSASSTSSLMLALWARKSLFTVCVLGGGGGSWGKQVGRESMVTAMVAGLAVLVVVRGRRRPWLVVVEAPPPQIPSPTYA